jgi:diacylglycerol kinase (ATP)
MRAAAILGLGCSPKDLEPFQTDHNIEWQIGMPATRDDADVILLFGGDGTIHRHLAQLVKLKLPVLVVPAGSGNDFARALGLRGVRDSLAAWEKFCSGEINIREIDLGVIKAVGANTETGGASARNSALATHYFCSIASVGLDTEVARRANLLPRWLRGHGGYALSLAPAIFTFAPFLLKILIPDGKTDPAALNPSDLNPAKPNPPEHWAVRSHQPTMLAAFANTPLYGGGMKVAPRAKMDDGLLDVCVVGSVNPLKLLSMFPTVYAGRHLGIREVKYFQSPRVRIETEHAMDVYADGEFVCRTPVEVSIERATLKAVTPAA